MEIVIIILSKLFQQKIAAFSTFKKTISDMNVPSLTCQPLETAVSFSA